MVYFIFNSKGILIVLISSNKYLVGMLLGSIWESATPLCMTYKTWFFLMGNFDKATTLKLLKVETVHEEIRQLNVLSYKVYITILPTLFSLTRITKPNYGVN